LIREVDEKRGRTFKGGNERRMKKCPSLPSVLWGSRARHHVVRPRSPSFFHSTPLLWRRLGFPFGRFAGSLEASGAVVFKMSVTVINSGSLSMIPGSSVFPLDLQSISPLQSNHPPTTCVLCLSAFHIPQHTHIRSPSHSTSPFTTLCGNARTLTCFSLYPFSRR
jgi:hypothetical protein